MHLSEAEVTEAGSRTGLSRRVRNTVAILVAVVATMAFFGTSSASATEGTPFASPPRVKVTGLV